VEVLILPFDHQSVVMLMDRAFLAAVDLIYDAAPDPSLWPDALDAVAKCFDDVGANLFWRTAQGTFEILASPGLEESGREYQRVWFTQDVRAIRASERQLWLLRDSVTDRHVVTEQEMATHPFYTEFLAKYGLRWVASAGVSPNPSILVAVSVQRSASKPAFSDDELDLLTVLSRHVEKSLRLSVRLLDAELRDVEMQQALSRLGVGVITVEAGCRVRYANAAAERLLVDHGIRVKHQQLHFENSAAQEELDRTVSNWMEHAADSALRRPIPHLIRASHRERPVTVYILPVIRWSTEPSHFLTRTRAIVLVIDQQPADPLDPSTVRDLLDLTLGEARVAALIGAGISPKEAAERLGVAEATARNTLKRVFSKVGVSRQSELAVLLSRFALR
jgi:DNA-binding CsgD family transcriptional regulator/PAS domain-containing protein